MERVHRARMLYGTWRALEIQRGCGREDCPVWEQASAQTVEKFMAMALVVTEEQKEPPRSWPLDSAIEKARGVVSRLEAGSACRRLELELARALVAIDETMTTYDTCPEKQDGATYMICVRAWANRRLRGEVP